MNPVGSSIRPLAGALLLALATFSLSCGSTDFAGGGTGGTGISTGAVSGYGSVVVNGVHFRTDDEVAPWFHTEKMSNGEDKSGRKARDVFSVGMAVTVRHGAGDNNAQVIEYRDNLRGPIAEMPSGAGNILEILGQSVIVDDAAIFASLKRGDIVEVSGFVDNAGRIRASYILPMAPPMPPRVQEFEVKGFVSESSSTGFRLGPLPDGSGMTVAVSYDAAAIAGLSGRLDNGIFVQVTTTDAAPVAGSITATRIERLASRTEFPDGTPVDLEGLVTTLPGGSGKILSFTVEGKRIRTDDATNFTGHSPVEIQLNTKLLVQGTETGGALSAVNIIFR